MDALESGSKLANQRARELSEQLEALTGTTPEAAAAREAAALAHESAADSALSGMMDAFDDYFHETQSCGAFVSETTPVMTAVLRKVARAIEEELSAAMAALRSGPLIEADCPPAEVEQYLTELREHLSNLCEHADEAREHQRLFEAASLLELGATEAAAWALWSSRAALWSALKRWEAFLQRVEDTEFAATQHIAWAEVEAEILAVDTVVAALEALPLTTDMHVVDCITLEETTFVQVLRGRIDRWKGYMPMLRKLCDPALQAHHWHALWQQLSVEGGGGGGGASAAEAAAEANVSLARLLRAGVLESPGLVEAIWKQATQEELLLLQLDAMEARCDALELAFSSFQEGGCHPFANLGPLAQAAQREQAALDAMKGSPYLPGVVGRFEQLESLLDAIAQALDGGARCTAAWRLLRSLLGRRCYTPILKAEMGRMETLHGVWSKILQVCCRLS